MLRAGPGIVCPARHSAVRDPTGVLVVQTGDPGASNWSPGASDWSPGSLDWESWWFRLESLVVQTGVLVV